MSENINICWVTGNYFERYKVIQKVKALLASKGSYDLSVYGKDESFEYVNSQVIEQSCIDNNQRLIIINDWPNYTTTKPTMFKHFAKMLKRVGDNTVVICNNLKTESESFLKEIDPFTRFYDFDTEANIKYTSKLVGKYIASKEKMIEMEDAELIVKSVGTKENGYMVDLDRIYAMCNKVCEYSGRKKTIVTEDILLICNDESDFVLWNLFDNLDKKDFCTCVKLTQRGIESAKKVQDFVIYVFNMLNWRYKLLLLAKDALHNGMAQDEVENKIMDLYKLERTGSNFKMKYAYETVEKDNKPKIAYNKKVIDKIFDGSFKTPPVMCYKNRKELYSINLAIKESIQKMYYSNDAELIVLLDAIYALICGVASYDELSRIRRISYGKFC